MHKISDHLRALLTPVSELKNDPANLRLHPRESIEAIKGSLERFGQQRPILIDDDGVVVAGNGVFASAKDLGWTHVAAIRSSLSGAEKLAYGIADNRIAELSAWDKESLLRVAETIDEDLMLATGFSQSDLSSFENELPKPEIEEEETPAPAPAKQKVSMLGDLWMMGNHRLLCGDATCEGQVDRLLTAHILNLAFTSPPYASQREYDEASGFKPIHPDDFVQWWEDVQRPIKARLAKDGSFFVNIKPACVGLERLVYVFDLVLAMKRKWGWIFAEEFCWERVGIPQRVVRRFKNQFEPVYQFVLGDWKIFPKAVMHASDKVPIAMGKGAGDTNAARRQGFGSAIQGNETEEGLAYPGNRLPTFSGSHELTGHSAAFPVGLPSFFITAYTEKGDKVYEPFCGSGSTLVACERLDRQCFGMEISPQYCDVIVRRWQKLTGKEATLEGDGRTWAEIAKARGVALDTAACPSSSTDHATTQDASVQSPKADGAQLTAKAKSRKPGRATKGRPQRHADTAELGQR